MLSFGLLAVGKIKDKNILSAIEQYQKMLKPYVLWQVFELKPEKFSDSNQVQAQRLEQQRLLEFIGAAQQKNNWQPILLTEMGKRFSSVALADYLSNLSGQPLFVLGGALGFDEQFKNSFKNQLSLSDLTMPHELARLVLTEQVYRIATIINGKKYHY